MKKSLKSLVNEFYTDEQKEVVNEIAKKNEKHLLNYKVLSLAFGDKLENLSKQEIKDFYQLENGEWLTEVDFVIENILSTLSKELNKDVRSEYENSITMDKNEPEFEYLVNEVKKYLSTVKSN